MPAWLCRLFPALCPPPPPPPPAVPPRGPGTGSTQDDWREALNRERRRAGLMPMVTDTRLADSAQAWAETMAEAGPLMHGDFQGRVEAVHPHVAAGSEDIAAGQSDVTGVLAAWMASPLHRANLLGNYNRTGIGHAIGANGVIFWVADFLMI